MATIAMSPKIKTCDKENGQMHICEIFSVLSDEKCVDMFQKIAKHKPVKMKDFETPRRYYSRIARLREANLIRPAKTGQQRFKITALGQIFTTILNLGQRATDLSWRLMAVDSAVDSVPEENKEEFVNTLIPDESIKGLLLASK